MQMTMHLQSHMGAKLLVLTPSHAFLKNNPYNIIIYV